MKDASVRIKLLLSVWLLIFAVLGTSTIVQVTTLRRDYLEAIEWRSEALAQSLIINITQAAQYILNVQELLETEALQCVKLYEASEAKSLTHIAVINEEGQIAAHNDYSVLRTPVESPELLERLQRQEKTTFLDGDIYHTLVPIFKSSENLFLGTVDIGFPKQAVDEKVRHILLNSFSLFGLFLLVAFFSGSLLISRLITIPIKRLITSGEKLTEGQITQRGHTITGHDEIARLEKVFQQISDYMQHIIQVASQIANGDVECQVQIRSESDKLGNTVQGMVHYLRNVTEIATNIAEGDLTQTLDIRSEEDVFGRIMLSMTEGLHSLIMQIRISAEEIAKIKTCIASLSQQDNDIVQQVEESLERMTITMSEMGKSVEEVAHNMETLSSSVEETSASVTQMSSSSRAIATDTSKLKQQTDETTAFLKETVQTLQVIVEHTEVSKNLSQGTIQDAREGEAAVEQVMSDMETIHQTVTTASESITRFDQRSQDIGTILDVIQGIIEQTSLLALNASIIAAQAGSQGRGFAVVADEIKNLADGVRSSTKDIGTIVTTLKTETQQVVHNIYDGAEKVKAGVSQTQQAREILRKIINSAERSSSVVAEIAETLYELLQNSRQIATAMTRVSTMTADIMRATTEQETSSVQIRTAVEHINDMAAHIHQATAEQLSGVHQLLDASQQITSLMSQNQESSHQIGDTAKELSLQAEMLLQAVDRFKLRQEKQNMIGVTQENERPA